jgi:subtilisin family serine protease
LTTGSPEVVVAIVDSGVDLDHSYLTYNILQGRDFVELTGVPPAPGWHYEGDYTSRDSTPEDEVGHGSHVAGTVASYPMVSLAVTGVTHQCKILPVRVLARMVRDADSTVTGVGTSADIAAGIVWAVDHGAHIINLSLGGTEETFVERDAVTYARENGVLVVAAMGNGFERGNPISYPAAFDGVIAVGAVDEQHLRANFSQTGSHIDCVAPGVDIRSLGNEMILSRQLNTTTLLFTNLQLTRLYQE